MGALFFCQFCPGKLSPLCRSLVELALQSPLLIETPGSASNVCTFFRLFDLCISIAMWKEDKRFAWLRRITGRSNKGDLYKFDKAGDRLSEAERLIKSSEIGGIETKDPAPRKKIASCNNCKNKYVFICWPVNMCISRFPYLAVYLRAHNAQLSFFLYPAPAIITSKCFASSLCLLLVTCFCANYSALVRWLNIN